jgi:hypothetical protein
MIMNKETQTSRGDSILNAIKKGEVKMRPKWHFILRGTLLGVGTALVILTLVYIASFILFVLRQNGVWFLPAFGFRGLGLLFFSLPWILIAVAILFIVILELLVKQYSFGYRRPLLYSALGGILLVVIAGFIIAQTGLHSHFYRDARAGRLPFGGELYRGFGSHPPHDVHPCTILEMNEQGFKAEEINDDIVQVVITADTEFPSGTNFTVDDKVLVLGQRKGDIITAQGIRKIDPERDHIMHHGTSTPHMRLRILPPQ